MRLYQIDPMKLIGLRLKHPGTGCLLIRSSIENPFQGLTSDASPKHMFKQSSKNFMPDPVEDTLGEDP
jgi:hypothetical protein